MLVRCWLAVGNFAMAERCSLRFEALERLEAERRAERCRVLESRNTRRSARIAYLTAQTLARRQQFELNVDAANRYRELRFADACTICKGYGQLEYPDRYVTCETCRGTGNKAIYGLMLTGLSYTDARNFYDAQLWEKVQSNAR